MQCQDIYLSVYVLLCLFWFEVFPAAFMNRTVALSRLRRRYLVINAILYSFWLTFLGLVAFGPNENVRLTAHKVEAWFTITISLGMGVLFLICGLKLYFKLTNSPIQSKKHLEVCHKVWILTVVFSAVFIVRAPLLYAGFFVTFSVGVNYCIHVFFPLFLQGLPTILVIVLLGRKKQSTEEKNEYAKLNSSSPRGYATNYSD